MISDNFSRREIGRKLVAGGFPLVAAGLLLRRPIWGQSGWNPGGVNATILNGIINNGGGMYNSWKQSGTPLAQGGWVTACDMYMGLVEQLRENGFDSLSDTAFASPTTPSAGDVAAVGSALIARGYNSSVTEDLQAIFNDSTGQETATLQQINGVGGLPGYSQWGSRCIPLLNEP